MRALRKLGNLKRVLLLLGRKGGDKTGTCSTGATSSSITLKKFFLYFPALSPQPPNHLPPSTFPIHAITSVEAAISAASVATAAKY